MRVSIVLLVAALAAAGCSKGGGAAASGQSTFLVSPPSGSTLTTGSTGQVYSQTFTVLSGGTGPYSFGGVAIPNGMSVVQLTNNAAALTGTPTQSGTGIVYIGLVDATQKSETLQYQLTIQGGTNTLTVNPATLSGTFVAGQPFSQQLTTTGTPPITWTSTGTLPNGITLTSSQVNTITMSGAFTRTGTFNFSINTQDATGATGTRAYTVTIN